MRATAEEIKRLGIDNLEVYFDPDGSGRGMPIPNWVFFDTQEAIVRFRVKPEEQPPFGARVIRYYPCSWHPMIVEVRGRVEVYLRPEGIEPVPSCLTPEFHKPCSTS